MPIPLASQAQVYWRTSQELRQAREDGDAIAEAEALYELLDLGAFTKRDHIRRLCLSCVPLVVTTPLVVEAKG